MDRYVIKKSEIDSMAGLQKQHFMNKDAQRQNKSLGDLTGLKGLGFHIIEVPPGKWSTECHVHYFEDECTYVLKGSGEVVIGNETTAIGPGDFIGYRAGGLAHTMFNSGDQTLVCIVVGQRLPHDVADYPHHKKRIYRNSGMPWDLADLNHVENPTAGEK